MFYDFLGPEGGGPTPNEPDGPGLHQGPEVRLALTSENLSPERRQRLETLLAANERLNSGYALKEQFGRLWATGGSRGRGGSSSSGGRRGGGNASSPARHSRLSSSGRGKAGTTTVTASLWMALRGRGDHDRG